MKKFLFVFFSGIFIISEKEALAAAPSNVDPSCSSFNQLVETLGGTGVFQNLPKICTVTGMAAWLITQMLTLAGIVATLFIIYGGFLYVASAGNEENSEKGKKILTNSIIGLIVIILASTIVRVIASTVAGN